MTGSVRSEFVTGLPRLDKASTKARLIAVRKAVHARLVQISDPDVRHHLQIVADQVDRTLLETSRLSVERLANALAESHGEAPAPSAFPRVPARQVRS